MAKTVDSLKARLRYWFPTVNDRECTRVALARFYDTDQAYHDMTACEGKVHHPQVRLLFSRLAPSDVCVEFGCGGGVVLAATARKARLAIGLDVACLALRKARMCTGDNRPAPSVVLADVAAAPIGDNRADVAYSFEVLEHVWAPEAVLREMIRVTRPGGLIIFSAPNRFSLNLHLHQRLLVRGIDYALAAAVRLANVFRSSCFQNLEPELTASPPYADCDMVASFFPANLGHFLRHHGCIVERLDTHWFQANKAANPAARRRYERLDRHWFYKNYGDHILCVARKQM